MPPTNNLGERLKLGLPRWGRKKTIAWGDDRPSCVADYLAEQGITALSFLDFHSHWVYTVDFADVEAVLELFNLKEL